MDKPDPEKTSDRREVTPENDSNGTLDQGTESHLPAKSRRNKNKKKVDDSNGSEQVIKASGNGDDKLSAMSKKYASVLEENKKLMAQVKLGEKKALLLQREKEQLQMEHSKAILTRSRLESLCRELQKQNKQIKEESLQRVREEEEKRKSVSDKFQSTLSEITVLMQQNNENNAKLRNENIEMQNKFKTLCEEHESGQDQVIKMSALMQLQSQSAEAKLNKLKLEMVTQKEKLENDKKQLLIKLATCQHKYEELQKTQVLLNFEVNMYKEKYKNFQDVLTNSNQLYSDFKGEIKNMSKKISKLEKETSVWRTRWENDHKALLQVSAEKLQATKQLTQLQKLCRTLQGDRSSLLMQLKSEGIAPKLSGDTKSVEESKESQTEVKDSNAATNGTETSADDGNLANDEGGTNLEKDSVEDVQGSSQTGEDSQTSENLDDVSKTNSNSKTKKTKERSKKR